MNAIFYETSVVLLMLITAIALFSVYCVIAFLPVVLSRTAIPAGFKSERVSVLGRHFLLVEITALHRLNYLKRCGSLNAQDGFEMMRDDLQVSTDLIALHLRRWYLPRWFIAFTIRQLSAATIAELFRHCVALSGIPFSIEPAEPVDSVEGSDALDDDWDYIDEEKKQHPAARH